jgi:hypothetical protein
MIGVPFDKELNASSERISVRVHQYFNIYIYNISMQKYSLRDVCIEEREILPRPSKLRPSLDECN